MIMVLSSVLTLVLIQFMICYTQIGGSGLTRLDRSHSRIFGGHEVYPKYSYPWQVSLQIEVGSKLKHFCGGSLLHNRFVLTAGHCVDEDVEEKKHLLTVVAGDHNLYKNEGHESYHPVKTITIHPNYVIHGIAWAEWDFAMLELAKEVSYSWVARPICLPSPRDTHFSTKTEVVATGWGETGKQGQQKSRPLQEVGLNWFDNCKNERPCKDCGFDEESTICVKGNKGQNLCPGDSGGPLAWYDAETDMMKVIGVASYGPDKCGAHRPGAYSKVTAALDWIEEIMSGYTFYQDVICDSFN